MNSYTLAEKLRKARRQYTISAGAQGLYYELIAICNEEQWSSQFKCRNGELCVAINVVEKTLIAYRDNLAEAGLLVYFSGQANHEPCVYSLNGCTEGFPVGCINGGKIYSSSVSRSGSRLVGNVTDLNKTKSKTETKHFVVEADVKVQARKIEIDDAVEKFCEADQNSNASFPEQAHLPEKEKSSGKKEKALPTLDEAMQEVCKTASWRNTLEHWMVPKGEDGKCQPVTPELVVQLETERTDLFKIFYEQKEDEYKARGRPSWNEMAKNFYFWVKIHQDKNTINNIKNIINGNGNTNNKTTGVNYRKRSEETRNELTNLRDRSREFLRKTGTDNGQMPFPG